MTDGEADSGGDGGDGGSLVAIAHVFSQPEAAVIAATLRAYGFEVLAGSQAAIAAMPDLMLALGGIPIAVPAGQAEDAIALMAEIDSGWTCPPAPFDPAPAVNGAASIASSLLGGTPMPRVEGDYAWRRPQARPEPPSAR